MDQVLAKAIQAAPDGARAASEIWKRLDQLAENNPTAYKKFIEEQLKEAGNSDVANNISRGKPAAVLTAARLRTHTVGLPNTIVIAIFASGSCIKPNTTRNSVSPDSKHEAETLDVKFLV